MKVALIGSGKTGIEVKNLHQDTIVFNTTNAPTFEKLKSCDVIICFLPGDAFLNTYELIVESKLPSVIASTGFEWPSNVDKVLKENKLSWIYSSNFSPSMAYMQTITEQFNKINALYDNAELEISETHHTKKVDAPSGTALTLNAWLEGRAKIDSTRVGDVIGIHEISIKTPYENIKLNHQVNDRSAFAYGSLIAAKALVNNKVSPGLHNFLTLYKDTL